MDNLPDDALGGQSCHSLDDTIILPPINDDGMKPESRIFADYTGSEGREIGSFSKVQLLLEPEV